MTRRYAHLRDDALKRAAGTVDDILDQVTKNNGKTIGPRMERVA